MFNWIKNWVNFTLRQVDPEAEALEAALREKELQQLVLQSCKDQKEWIAKRNPGVRVRKDPVPPSDAE